MASLAELEAEVDRLAQEINRLQQDRLNVYNQGYAWGKSRALTLCRQLTCECVVRKIEAGFKALEDA